MFLKVLYYVVASVCRSNLLDMHEINLEKSSVLDQLFFKIELSSKKVLKLVPIKTSSIYCLKTNFKEILNLFFVSLDNFFFF